MTEAEWLACEDLQPILKHWEAKATSRKRRLLACAYCRHRWAFLRNEASRSAVEIAERYADKSVTKRALIAARKAARAVMMALDDPYWERRGAPAALNAVEEREGFVFGAAVNISGAVVCNTTTQDSYEETKAIQTALLRDVAGDPYRPARLGSCLVTPGAISLAQAAYEERELPTGYLDKVRLAILADALEDAGCADADLLAHLRSGGPHVRGCWALDLILGRQ